MTNLPTEPNEREPALSLAARDEPIDLIPAEQARALLEAAIRERIGDDWEDDESGWVRVTGHDYMTRLTKGRINLDFYVDLLGNVTVEEREIPDYQNNGRLIAWMLLLVSLGIAFLVARAIGVF